MKVGLADGTEAWAVQQETRRVHPVRPRGDKAHPGAPMLSVVLYHYLIVVSKHLRDKASLPHLPC